MQPVELPVKADAPESGITSSPEGAAVEIFLPGFAVMEPSVPIVATASPFMKTVCVSRQWVGVASSVVGT